MSQRHEVKLDVIGQELMATLELVKTHMAELNKAEAENWLHMAALSQQVVVFYTMHTLSR